MTSSFQDEPRGSFPHEPQGLGDEGLPRYPSDPPPREGSAAPARAQGAAEPQSRGRQQGWGTEPAGDRSYAGVPTDPQGRPLAQWWKRVVAFIIDVIIVNIASTIIYLVVGGNAQIAAILISLIITFAYFTALNGSPRGQTVGKMALGIAVRDMDSGSSIGPVRAFSRALAEYVLFALFILPWLVDVLWPLWDPQRQAWHDKAVRSLVVDLSWAPR